MILEGGVLPALERWGSSVGKGGGGGGSSIGRGGGVAWRIERPPALEGRPPALEGGGTPPALEESSSSVGTMFNQSLGFGGLWGLTP